MRAAPAGPILALAIAAASAVAAPLASPSRVALEVDASEAEAVLAILALAPAERLGADAAWERLLESEPYVRLKRREISMNREFSDEDFRAFVLSPGLAVRAADLRRTLASWVGADLGAVAERILPYLPPDARVRAKVYPVIKPRTNSFVFETDTDPAIFVYLDPEQSPTAFANTIAHECHHVGYADTGRRYDAAIASLPGPARKAAEWMGAFGEGLAVLAAAGSSGVHPMQDFPEEELVRWDQDMRYVDQQVATLDRFFLDAVDAGFARPEVADHVAFTFFGYRGPWYTVGHRMAVVVERCYGREALLACMADPRALLATYDAALEAGAEPGAARWSPRLLEAVGACPVEAALPR